MTDEELLELDFASARAHLRTLPRHERLRLGSLYEARKSVEILEDHSGSQTLVVMGVVLALGGIVLGLWTLNYDVGVSTSLSSYGSALDYGMREVANVDKIGIRQVLATLASGTFVAGAIFISAGRMLRGLAR